MDEATRDPRETQQLLQQAASGNRQAFERLFATHRAYLRQFVELRMDKKLRARLDPSDVVQEAHLEALRRLETYLEHQPLPFRLWLRQIAHDRLLNLRRDHVEAARRAVGREVPLPESSTRMLAQQLLAGGKTPSQEYSLKEVSRRVGQALEQMPTADREILLLRHFEGLSYDEVSCLLRINPATARKRYGRALLRLQRVLCDHGLLEPGP